MIETRRIVRRLVLHLCLGGVLAVLYPLEIDAQFTDVTSTDMASCSQAFGVSWTDFDGDGDLDFYVSQLSNAGVGTVCPNRLYRNDGDVFVRVNPGAAADPRYSVAATWADFDNDRDLDVYVGNGDTLGDPRNALYRNDGGGSFSDATTPPLDELGWAHSVVWADYDRDGLVDLYISNRRNNSGSAPTTTNKLFQNQGSGQFVDVTTAPLNPLGAGGGVAWADYDNDGDLDLYYAHEQGNHLLRNDDGVFVDGNVGALVGVTGGHGVAWGDYDNDADLDLTVVGVANDLLLFRNDGTTFADVTTGDLAVQRFGAHSVAWADYDNDGDLDFYVSREWPFCNSLFRNDGAGVFVLSTPTAVQRCVNFGRGVAWGDYDEDGDLDLLLGESANSGGVRLIRNDNANGNRWLHVIPKATLSNRAAIGTRVTLTTSSGIQVREVSGGSGLASQDSLPVEFGLGPLTAVDTVQVRWQRPKGPQISISNVSVDQRLVVYETAVGVRRGASPVDLQPYELTSWFPWTDPEPVLSPKDEANYFYELDDPLADIRLVKDLTTDSIRIVVRN